MASSTLTYRRLNGGRDGASAVFVILHGRGSDEQQLAPLCTSLTPRYDAYLLRAPVPVTPPTGYGSDPAERSWYHGEPIDVPEPVSFGNSLWQLERFLRDVREQWGIAQPIVLCGDDQGAVLALTMAAIAPDWLAGVVAMEGVLPSIEGWSVPAGDMAALPVLLVYANERRTSHQQWADETTAKMLIRGARVDCAWVQRLEGMTPALTGVLSAWLIEQALLGRPTVATSHSHGSV